MERGAVIYCKHVFWRGLREALAEDSVTHAKTSTVSALSDLVDVQMYYTVSTIFDVGHVGFTFHNL